MKNLIFHLILLSVIFLYSFKTGENLQYIASEKDPPFVSFPTPWADSLIHKLTLEEKIAQLLMVAAYSNRDKNHVQKLNELVEEYGIGGLIFFQGGPHRQAAMCNELQSHSKIPLLVGMDAEWGLAMRLDSTVRYPWQMTLGAIRDDRLIFKMGVQIAEQLTRLGVHINFAPVVDVNVNPENPVINARSFGESKMNVSSKGIAYMQGLQSGRILACAKHFPGHGDTDKDSHRTLPTINHRKERLDTLELFPFRELIANGLSSVMVAHLYMPALEKEFNIPATLSGAVVNGLLKDSMRFEGLVITDALNMKAVSDQFKPGDLDVKALLAGNDILLFSEDVPRAVEGIKKAIREKLIEESEIDRRCLKILRAKEWVGLHHYKPVDLTNLSNDLNKTEYRLLNRKLMTFALTLVENKNELLPLQRLDTLKIAAIAIGNGEFESFHRTLAAYNAVDTFHLSFDPLPKEQKRVIEAISDYNLLIVSIHTTDKSPYNRFFVEEGTADFLTVLRLRKKVILVSFANPYALRKIHDLDHFDALLQAYQNNEDFNNFAAQAIFGGIGTDGRLPVSIDGNYRLGRGIEIQGEMRLNYVLPEEIGIQGKWLDEIDSISIEGIQKGAYPGCQVLAARNGKVFYHRTFGYHTYDSSRQVRVTDLYDLASVTKIASTLPVIMELNQRGVINLDYALCDYLPELVDSTRYANLSLREILAHQAGLPPWIAFYKSAMYKGKLRYDVFSMDSSGLYSNHVAKNLWMNHHYADSMFSQIFRTTLNASGEYRYSDIGYYFLKQIAEKYTGQDIGSYVRQHYYKPMGMSRTCFNPLHHFSTMEIVPTERDDLFRKQLVHGYVHDPGAAMLGGVGGHAGLFSNANDLAKLMQLYVNGGNYGGRTYFSDTIVTEYTSCQYCENDNRRGAGFDKPMVRGDESGPTCGCVSILSFGHSGFTGTYAWADPADGTVFIFLSNRVYPNAENKLLVSLGIRTRIQEVIHRAVERSSSTLITDSLKDTK